MEYKNKTISVLGCGWYGMELAKKLAAKGYQVNGSSTSADKISLMQEAGINPFIVNFKEEEESFDADFFNCGILFIAIPPKRNSTEQHTFLSKIKRIAKAASRYQVANIIFISSTAIFGDVNQEVTELSVPHPDTESGKIMLAAESFLTENHSFKTTIIRFGGLIGPGRDPGKFFAGKTAIPNGLAPVNLIHLTDCLALSLRIIEQEAYGHIFNACSTQHPSRAEFYTHAARISGLPEPSFINELTTWKRVNSKNIDEYLDYEFQIQLYTSESQQY